MDANHARPESSQMPIKKRTRASVACNNCRIKRSKCDGATVGTPCSQCNRQNLKCEMPRDGKKQRPFTRMQVEALTERVKLLENMLNVNSLTQQPTATEENLETTNSQSPVDQQNITIEGISAIFSDESDQENSVSDDLEHGWNNGINSSSANGYDFLDWQPDVIPRTTTLLKTTSRRGGSFVQENPTRPSVTRRKSSMAHERPPSIKTAGSPQATSPNVAELSPAFVDHLLEMYFRHFQIMLKIVHEEGFVADRRFDGPSHYKESLLLAMLAAGARFSNDPVLKTLYTKTDGRSAFAARSKLLLESEVRHSDVQTVQTLLILAELETAAGNEMSGCMYSGMASRLIFDLKLDPASSQQSRLPSQEIMTRHWMLWCASVQDKYWAQTIQRPLTIKNMDLQLSRLITRFAKQSTIPKFEEIIDESVLDLMELAREAAEFLYGSTNFHATIESYSAMARLTSKLDRWFQSLPQAAREGPASTNITYIFVFILHMQFHLTKIQLHQLFAFASPRQNSNDSASYLTMSSIISNCRKVCVSSAITVAKLFETFRRKHDIRYLQTTGTQYAAFATRALIKHIINLPVDQVVEPEAHLRSLIRTLQDMSRTFQSAIKPLEEAEQALKAMAKRCEMDTSALSSTQIPVVQIDMSLESPRSSADRMIRSAQAPKSLLPPSNIELFPSTMVDLQPTMTSVTSTSIWDIEELEHHSDVIPIVQSYTQPFIGNRNISEMQPLPHSPTHEDTPHLEGWEEIFSRS